MTDTTLQLLKDVAPGIDWVTDAPGWTGKLQGKLTFYIEAVDIYDAHGKPHEDRWFGWVYMGPEPFEGKILLESYSSTPVLALGGLLAMLHQGVEHGPVMAECAAFLRSQGAKP